MATAVDIIVPDNIFAGDAFLVEYRGQQLAVSCPEGCGPGVAIQVEVPAPDAEMEARMLEVIIPQSLFPGDDFLVEFGGEQFSVVVPVGCSAGEPIVIEVPRPTLELEPLLLAGLSPKDHIKQPAGCTERRACESVLPHIAPATSQNAQSTEWAPTSSIFSMGPPSSLNGQRAGAHRKDATRVYRGFCPSARAVPAHLHAFLPCCAR